MKMDRLQLPKMPFAARDAAVEASGAGSSPGWRERFGLRMRGRRLPFLAGLLALLILIDAAVVVFDARQATFNTVYVAAVGKIRMLSQRLAKAAQQASQGNSEAFKQLRDSRDEFAAVFTLLTAGGAPPRGAPPPPPGPGGPGPGRPRDAQRTNQGHNGVGCWPRRQHARPCA